MSRKQYPSDKQDQFVLRLPDGLRDRIKLYAERQGRSMNAEIVRILEREYPKPLEVWQHISVLLDLIQNVRVGAKNEAVAKLNTALAETIEQMISGQITGLSDEDRHHIQVFWEEQQMLDSQDEIWNSDLHDVEERENYERFGKTAKIVLSDDQVKSVAPDDEPFDNPFAK